MPIKRGRVVRPPHVVEVRYRKALYLLVDAMRKDTQETIAAVLREYESEYVRDDYSDVITQETFDALTQETIDAMLRQYVCDDYADALTQAFNDLRQRYENLNTLFTAQLAGAFVQGVNLETLRRFRRSVENIAGVDIDALVTNEGLEPILKIETTQNVNLIKSIPQQYFKQIENIVYSGTITGNRSRSMIDEIMSLGHSTRKRARLIARDQTSKLTSGLIQQRQQNAGVTHYIWVTAQDGDRVRPTHQVKNGKVFAWASPPKDTGHPGHDINCRCIAQPIFNI